jgi:quercetin dioxygenase-like cupin family protein
MTVVPARSLVFDELPGRASANPFPGMDSGAMSLRLVRVVAGAGRTPHRHPESAEAIYVVRGRGQLWEEGSLRPVAAGDCALIPRGVPHATVPDPGYSMELVCFFPHPDLKANLEELDGPIDFPGRPEGTLPESIDGTTR